MWLKVMGAQTMEENTNQQRICNCHLWLLGQAWFFF